jgi:hypothetical protein
VFSALPPLNQMPSNLVWSMVVAVNANMFEDSLLRTFLDSSFLTDS